MGKEAGYFKKGNTGRPKGTQNKLTRTVRDTFQSVFDELQSDPKTDLKSFAKKNPVEFHRIVAKLIPTDLKAELTGENGGPIEQKFEITLKL